MTLLTASLLILSISILGGVFSFFIKHENQKLINYVLIITGAYLLSVVVLHLLPHSIEMYGEKSLLWVLAGFLIQFVLQQFSHGVEHGHTHQHHHLPLKELLVIGIGLSIHALTEGVPLAEKNISKETFSALLIGISIHKFPEAFALACLASHSLKTISARVSLIVAFGLLTPLSILLFSSSAVFSTSVFAVLFPLVTGSVLQIATSIIYETTGNTHQLKLIKLLLLLVGFGMGMVSFFV